MVETNIEKVEQQKRMCPNNKTRAQKAKIQHRDVNIILIDNFF